MRRIEVRDPPYVITPPRGAKFAELCIANGGSKNVIRPTADVGRDPFYVPDISMMADRNT